VTQDVYSATDPKLHVGWRKREATMSRRQYHRTLPQNLHILPKGHSTTRACGATSGGFVRERDHVWLKKFLKDGGGLCPECAKRISTREETQ
jgi:hypothetical protein